MTDLDLLLKAKEELAAHVEEPEAAAIDLPTDVKDGEITNGNIIDDEPIDIIP